MAAFFDVVGCIASWAFFLALAAIFPLVIFVRVLLKSRTRKKYSRASSSSSSGDSAGLIPVVVGFFHPYCNAGGGGERVLWCGIRSLQRRYEFVQCVVYTGDTEASPEQILARAKDRFNIELDRPVDFVYLNKRRWVEADMWPHFTLLGQSIGSMVLGLEALVKLVPDVYIDTMGYSFTYPLFRFVGGCKVSCYVHYPTISTDMLSKVRSREEAHNNAGLISSSFVLTNAKLAYYKLYAFLYGMAGKCSSVIMVNSSWTQNHIIEIWNKPQVTSVVFPPCDTTEFSKIENVSEQAQIKKILSIGQFRPEKNHALQIRSFHRFLNQLPKSSRDKYRLALVGSCRNSEDEKRVDALMHLCKELNIVDVVEFHLNIPYSELKEQLAVSMIGIHTMWNEHFGIGVVEFMAARVIPLAHNSGGPKLDIVTPWKGVTTGFLAATEINYAKAMKKIFGMKKEERNRMKGAAAESSNERFSEEVFQHNFLKRTESLLR